MTRRARHSRDPASTEVEHATKGTHETGTPACHVHGCCADPEVRGLCRPHWDTHRGLADPQGTA